MKEELDNLPNGTFITCSHCGKKLIKRLPNGLWHFVYGKRPIIKKGENGEETIVQSRNPPVEMIIHGSIKIRCLNSKCGMINTLTFLP